MTRRKTVNTLTTPTDLKAIREAQGLTQDDIALVTGLNRVSIWRIEQGRQRLKSSTARMIADIYEVDLGELVAVCDDAFEAYQASCQ